ncbi:MAG TPA: DUF1801 domain-containing protein [Rhodanobacteraceae bacterium]|nr:DUF1801 domain-containing protein [Rhodanobacteraceae bacterium]
MAENKTRPTKASVNAYYAKIENDVRRKDCKAIAAMMARATKEKATMWGPGIVGFGSYHYRYDSGREGDSCIVGFAARKGPMTLYLGDFPGRTALLARLGKHKTSNGCLYIGKLADVDTGVLEKLIAGAVAAKRKRLTA